MERILRAPNWQGSKLDEGKPGSEAYRTVPDLFLVNFDR